jgi:hypothetical protein
VRAVTTAGVLRDGRTSGVSQTAWLWFYVVAMAAGVVLFVT